MVVPQALAPFRSQPTQALCHHLAAVQFDAVALAVIEPDCLDVVEVLQRPGKTCRRVLAAGKENECSIVHTPASSEVSVGLVAIVLGPTVGGLKDGHPGE